MLSLLPLCEHKSSLINRNPPFNVPERFAHFSFICFSPTLVSTMVESISKIEEHAYGFYCYLFSVFPLIPTRNRNNQQVYCPRMPEFLAQNRLSNDPKIATYILCPPLKILSHGHLSPPTKDSRISAQDSLQCVKPFASPSFPALTPSSPCLGLGVERPP